MPLPVIAVHERVKRYGSTRAVESVSFEVQPGEIFGLIGPNGAGKTTTMECVQGRRRHDGGTTTVLGLDPHRDAVELGQQIGVQHPEAHLPKRIKVWEAVDLWSSRFPDAVDGEALLVRLGLASKRDTWFMSLSGGQKQRLFIALALIHQPKVVFLDEFVMVAVSGLFFSLERAPHWLRLLAHMIPKLSRRRAPRSGRPRRASRSARSIPSGRPRLASAGRTSSTRHRRIGNRPASRALIPCGTCWTVTRTSMESLASCTRWLRELPAPASCRR